MSILSTPKIPWSSLLFRISLEFSESWSLFNCMSIKIPLCIAIRLGLFSDECLVWYLLSQKVHQKPKDQSHIYLQFLCKTIQIKYYLHPNRRIAFPFHFKSIDIRGTALPVPLILPYEYLDIIVFVVIILIKFDYYLLEKEREFPIKATVLAIEIINDFSLDPQCPVIFFVGAIKVHVDWIHVSFGFWLEKSKNVNS